MVTGPYSRPWGPRWSHTELGCDESIDQTVLLDDLHAFGGGFDGCFPPELILSAGPIRPRHSVSSYDVGE